MNYEVFGFMIEVVVTVQFVFIATVAGALSVKAFGWLWDKVSLREKNKKKEEKR